MSLFPAFQQHFKNSFPQLAPTNCHLLLTVSGGVDSVVLTDLIHQLGFNFTIAHCNFQLRGEESQRDEAFVLALSSKYNVPILVKAFDTAQYAAEHKLSIQVAARELRYEWFSSLVIPNNTLPIYIVTAHHADDNIETVLMQFFRGTGIQGLTGIAPFQKEQRLLRPLLPFNKAVIVQYAEENQLAYVEDSSNQSNKYTRNFFRNQLLPQLKDIFPQVVDNLQENIIRFKEVETLYQQALEVHKKKILVQKGEEWHLAVNALKKAIPLNTVLWEIVKPFSFTPHQINDIIQLLVADNGAYIFSATHRIIKNRNWLIIAQNQTETAAFISIEATNNKIAFPEGVINLKEYNNDNQVKISTDPTTVCMDAANITFPLLLRKAKQGDYFYPLGMPKKKKIARFLIDLKLSTTQKEKVWVIESNKKIIWVVGLRIDDRVKITPTTKQILELNWKR